MSDRYEHNDTARDYDLIKATRLTYADREGSGLCPSQVSGRHAPDRLDPSHCLACGEVIGDAIGQDDLDALCQVEVKLAGESPIPCGLETPCPKHGADEELRRRQAKLVERQAAADEDAPCNCSNPYCQV